MLERINISFYLNHRKIEIGVFPHETALTLIRSRGLTGAKDVCNEGDCGACTIAVGKWVGNSFCYNAVNSCLFPAAKFHGKHIITVEGLCEKNKLHIIQNSLINHHGVQCGYCSSGIVMSLFCLFLENSHPNREDICYALEGNLCRCTGYNFIMSAAEEISNVGASTSCSDQWRNMILPSYCKTIHEDLKNISLPYVTQVTFEDIIRIKRYHMPNTLQQFWDIFDVACENGKIINGGTDIMVDANIRKRYREELIDISCIKELNYINKIDEQIWIGAVTTLSDILKSELIQKNIPVLCDAIKVTASTQIRNVATLSGNIANGSSIGDGTCALLGLDASIILQSKTGSRQIKLNAFYKGFDKYKIFDIEACEIISAIIIPIPKGFCYFEKSSKRSSVDVSAISTMMCAELYGTKEKIIKNFIIALNGVDKFPMLANKTIKYLEDKQITEDVINNAIDIINYEFNPRTDIRGSSDYRKRLIKNHLFRFFEILKSL